ncbi:MAG: malto-oligosyltrehalose synthase [Pirellulales bacterium]
MTIPTQNISADASLAQPNAPHIPLPNEAMSSVAQAVQAEVERELQSQRLPTATYRVQFNHQCSFREIEGVVPYLYALGISDLYASPFLQARPGSLHGYDIVDHGAINAEIGTLDEFRSLRSALREHDMGLLADVVPNHMCASPQLNPWWHDVLENGPSSSHATCFDIDWMPLKPDLAYKVLLPVLGGQFGRVLEDGQLVVRYDEGQFWLEYYEQRFPISPRSYSIILADQLEELRQRLGEEHADVLELLSILTAIKNLPPRTETNAERLVERRREKEVIKRRLHELTKNSSDVAAFVTDNLKSINGQPGQPRSFDRLDELLDEQAYRLAFWRVAADEINYRRFFDINELAAICTEHPQVFAESHRLLFELLDEGALTGLRIDHPDGLYDPRGYFRQLQANHYLRLCRKAYERITSASPGPPADADAWPTVEEQLRGQWWGADRPADSPLARPLFVTVEKILAHGEALPDDWPVHGTVGYEFLNAVNGLYVDPASERALSSFYTRFTGEPLDFEEMAYQSKRLIARMSMASELSVLGHRLDRISERNRRTRDLTLNTLTRALQEVIACFGVYRTYLEPGRLVERDQRVVELAVARAKRRNPAMDASIFNFVSDVLLLRFHAHDDEEERNAVECFVGKFQQLTGPIMAKAVEDTTFYRFNRLGSLNEVGGEPARFGATPDEFHQLNQSRLPQYSHAMNASSTHDTKRSEDVRARINVLSEIPKPWRECVQRWGRAHKRLKTEVDGLEAPSRNSEYLLYQTIIGTWPDALPVGDDRAAYVARLQQYMLKVDREAKMHTSWISPNEPYEAAVTHFVRGLFEDSRRRPFLEEVHELAVQVAEPGRWNSLSQLVLKAASPGVPDFFQGTELWNLTLVDPDNRHPVDYAQRRQLLDSLLDDMAAALEVHNRQHAVEDWLAADATLPQSAGPRIESFLQSLLEGRRDGRIKLFTTLLLLRARRQFPELFTLGDYLPLAATGPGANHLVALARQHAGQAAIALVPRLTVGLTGLAGPPPIAEVWGDTSLELPPALAGLRFQDIFTRAKVTAGSDGRTLRATDVLQRLPMALLIGERS